VILATKHTLRQFTDKEFSNTRLDWKKKAGEAEFASEYGVVFDWADTHREYDDAASVGNSLAYGIFSARATKACAIVDVVSHKKGRNSTTKLLKIYITPEYWDIDKHQDKVRDIFISAIIGTVELSKQVSARTVKLYGRSTQLLSLLHSLHVYMHDNKAELPGVTVAMKGRWLEIATTK
jgi:hypothetical protein